MQFPDFETWVRERLDVERWDEWGRWDRPEWIPHPAAYSDRWRVRQYDLDRERALWVVREREALGRAPIPFYGLRPG